MKQWWILEYYRKQLGNEVVQIDEFYINVNMIPEIRMVSIFGKAISAGIETGEEMWRVL